jgi:hypothetical protein
MLTAALLPTRAPTVTNKWEPKRASELIWKQDVYMKWTEMAADAVRGWLFENGNENLSSLIDLEMSEPAVRLSVSEDFFLLHGIIS